MTVGTGWVWEELGIAPSDDLSEIRRAYARRLKAIDHEIMALAVMRRELPAERFRAMAWHGGWDVMSGRDEGPERSLRQRVLTRLEADSWYRDLRLAARRSGRPKCVRRVFGRWTTPFSLLLLGRAPRWFRLILIGLPGGSALQKWMRRHLAACDRYRPWFDEPFARHLAWLDWLFPPPQGKPPLRARAMCLAMIGVMYLVIIMMGFVTGRLRALGGG